MREILYENEDYIVIKNKNIYHLRYFEECSGNDKYKRCKKKIDSRVTKNYNYIKQFIKK